MSIGRLHRFTTHDGRYLAYRCWEPPTRSASPVLLCLSGTTRNSLDFRRIGERYGQQQRVVALDWRGCGESEKTGRWRDYLPHKHILDVLALSVVAQLKDVIVVGTSLGGLVGMALCVSRPGLVSALVVNDIGPEMEKNGVARLHEIIRRRHRVRDRSEAETWCKNRFPALNIAQSDWALVADGTFTDDKGGGLVTNWDPAIAQAQRHAGHVNLWRLFTAARVKPMLLVRGARSEIFPGSTARKMTEQHPRLTYVSVPACGHAPDLLGRDVKESFDEFIRRINASGSSRRGGGPCPVTACSTADSPDRTPAAQ